MKLPGNLTYEKIADAATRAMCSLDNPGFCIACGHEQEGCEPDARRYICESCGEKQVYGAEELCIMIAL